MAALQWNAPFTAMGVDKSEMLRRSYPPRRMPVSRRFSHQTVRMREKKLAECAKACASKEEETTEAAERMQPPDDWPCLIAFTAEPAKAASGILLPR